MRIHRDLRAGTATALAAFITMTACGRRDAPSASTPAATPPSGEARPLPDPLPEVAARVNGEPVRTHNVKLMGELLIRKRTFKEDQRPEAYRYALEQFIERELLLQEAIAQGLTADQKTMEQAEDKLHASYPDDLSWRQFLAQQGFDPQSFKTELRAQHTVSALLKRMVISPSQITDDEVALYYRAHSDELTVAERYKVRHILIRVPPDVNPRRKGEFKTKAETLLVEARTGADFAKLAQAHSEDQATAAAGGLISPFGPGELDPRLSAIESVVATLAPGKISDVVESAAGFHILKLEERLPGGLRPLADVADSIREVLVQERIAAQRAKLVGSLRARAKIETYL
jgi:peptidyl-prolyl cis-trans isomerase SurA